MATFTLIPGGGGEAWYWHPVAALLEEAGHEVIAVDLPGDDPKAGLRAYADLVVAAIGARTDVILVALSMGGFTAPLVAARVPLRKLVFVNAMIPSPGETPEAWGRNTGSQGAREAAAKRGGYSVEYDDETYFFHDLSPDLRREADAHLREESSAAYGEAAAFEAWPSIPIHVVTGEGDRLFPKDLQARVARERLGKEIDVVPGGHLATLSQPRALADRLLAYAAEP